MKVWIIIAAALLLAQQASALDHIPRREKSKLSRRAREETSPEQRILTSKAKSKSKGRPGRPGGRTCSHGKPECWIDAPSAPSPGSGRSRALFSPPAPAPAPNVLMKLEEEQDLVENRGDNGYHPGKDPDDYACCQNYDIDQCDFGRSGGPYFDCIGYLHDGMAFLFPKDSALELVAPNRYRFKDATMYCCPNDCGEVEHCTDLDIIRYPCTKDIFDPDDGDVEFECDFEQNYLVFTSFDNGGAAGFCRIQPYCCPRKTPDQSLTSLGRCGGSCVSGNTGVIRVINGVDQVVKVSDLQLGNKLRGLDGSLRTSNDCKVLALDGWGIGDLYGNYTDDHYMYDKDMPIIKLHGKNGPKSIGEKFNVITTCPVIQDEEGLYFTATDGYTSPPVNTEGTFSWEEYLRVYEWTAKFATSNIVPNSLEYLQDYIGKQSPSNTEQEHEEIVACLLDGKDCRSGGPGLIENMAEIIVIKAKKQVEEKHGISLPDDLQELKTAHRILYQRRIRPTRTPLPDHDHRLLK